MTRWAPALLLVACSEYEIRTDILFDSFEQRPSHAVDWLFVVDDSCSMAPHQERLAAHFDTLVGEVLRADVDTHIGVITTDAASQHGRLRSEVLTPGVPDASARFRAAVDVGVDGSGFEMGLEASLLAVTEPSRSVANLGFLRDDARLVVLYVSDEEDNSPRPVADIANGLRGAVGSDARTAVAAHALVVVDAAACPSEGFEGSVGSRYAALADETGGLVLDLCADDLEPLLARLSLDASGLRGAFRLAEWPVPSSLEVEIDGAPSACGVGWHLGVEPGRDGDTVALRFDEVPPVGTRIVARYARGYALPEGPCG